MLNPFLVLFDLEVDLLLQRPVVLTQQVFRKTVCQRKDHVIGKRKDRDEDCGRDSDQVFRCLVVRQKFFERQIRHWSPQFQIDRYFCQLPEILVKIARSY